MIKADFHMHSFYSGDSEAPTEDMILSAIDKGLTHICFTEHEDHDFTYLKPEEKGMFDLDTVKYREGLLPLIDKYKDRISVGFGVELGVQPDIAAYLNDYVRKYPFDFVIASSHLCHKKDPYFPYFFEGRPVKEAITEYFESILENINAFTDFDVYGHLDYAVRYVPGEIDYRFGDYAEIFEAIFKELIEKGKGIEINTGGTRHKQKITNPISEAVRFYHDLGGEIITVGADGHKPEDIALNFNIGEKVLKEAGFNHYCIFKNRKPVFIDIP